MQQGFLNGLEGAAEIEVDKNNDLCKEMDISESNVLKKEFNVFITD